MVKIVKNKMYLSLVVMIVVLFGFGGCGETLDTNATHMDGKNTIIHKEFGNTNAHLTGKAIVKDSDDNVYITGIGYSASMIPSTIGANWKLGKDLGFIGSGNGTIGSYQYNALVMDNDKQEFYTAGSGLTTQSIIASKVKNNLVYISPFGVQNVDNYDSKTFISTPGVGNAIALDSSKNIYMAGQRNNQMSIWKTESNGSIVSSFGNSGIVTYSASATSSANAMVLDGSNNIYVAGTNIDKMAIWKYNSNGILDTTFGTNGVVTTTATASGNAMLLDSSNNIYIAGTSGDKMTLWKYTSNGTLTTTVTYPSSGKSEGYGIALDTTKNKIYITGYATDTNTDMTLWRYDTNLTLDTKFSENGFYSFPAMYNSGRGYGIVIGSTGDVYITGESHNSTGYKSMAVWKYEFYVDTTAPTFTSNATASVNENQTSALTLTTTDESSVAYSISGGDSGSFNLNSSTGVVTFKTAPDYETKTSYTFTVSATDENNNTKTQAVTISINDIVETISYATVTSPLTGKIWLDRNLGASQVCTSATDTACFGDYYQWGRSADGHEKSTATTTATQATTITSVGNQFITVTGGDWTTADSDGALRSANWSKTDGTSICPSGFRVPNLVELKAEFPDSSYKSYTSFLKIPASKARSRDGSMFDGMGGGYAALWASDAINGNLANRIYFYGTDVSMSDGINDKASGYSIRCIKN